MLVFFVTGNPKYDNCHKLPHSYSVAISRDHLLYAAYLNKHNNYQEEIFSKTFRTMRVSTTNLLQKIRTNTHTNTHTHTQNRYTQSTPHKIRTYAHTHTHIHTHTHNTKVRMIDDGDGDYESYPTVPGVCVCVCVIVRVCACIYLCVYACRIYGALWCCAVLCLASAVGHLTVPSATSLSPLDMLCCLSLHW
jgi:hypothetical protein